jgi:hypothetical protein
MLIGGLLGYFVRILYCRFAGTTSNREKFSLTFAPVIMATVLIIFVVKSSLALSLGLVGALSIVRFRAAIKEPEEIVYLFFCIAIGLSLGAEYLPLAFAGVTIFTAFILFNHRRRSLHIEPSLLLTISGPMNKIFEDDPALFTRVLDDTIGNHVVQRFELEDGFVQFRATLSNVNQANLGDLLARLQLQLPGFRLSYVNLENLI